MTNSTAPLTVIILNHEHWPCAVSQLEEYYRDSAELFFQTRWIVVHNGPVPPPRLQLAGPNGENVFEAVEVHVQENRGYGAGINFALTLTDSPMVLALNSDLLPEPGFLRHIYQQLQPDGLDAKVAIVGYRLLNPDGSLQGSVGRFPKLTRMLFGLLKPRAKRKYVPLETSTPCDVDWVTGACILLRKRFLDEVGKFDERFFMYYEDVDLCKRAWDAGWRVIYEPRATLRHFFPYHTRALTHRMVFLARHGMLTYFFKHRPAWEFRIVSLIALLECQFREKTAGWERVRQMIQRFRSTPENATIDAQQLP